MTNADGKHFVELWGSVQELYNKNCSNTSYKLAFNALSDFSIEQIEQGLEYVVKNSKFAPTVADVREAIKRINGLDSATLELKANDFYNKINYAFNMGKDLVCDDARAVFAFKRAFGSAKDFGSHPISADPFDRKAFVELYVNARPELYENDPDKFVIPGIYHDSVNPSVRFIGNPVNCKAIALTYYKDKHPLLPHPQEDKPKVEHLPKVEQIVDKNGIDNLINALTELVGVRL